jgi:homoserine/homoserine lactone efflux protein
LSATYIVVDGLFLSGYGFASIWIASKLKGEARPWIERFGGGFMIDAAILLGLKTGAKAW